MSKRPTLRRNRKFTLPGYGDSDGIAPPLSAGAG
jgi:hypothetical protein